MHQHRQYSDSITVWDIWIRLFHWALASSVIFQLFSGKTGNGFFDWHRYVGEVIFALILFRVLWAFFGSSNTRWSTLVSHPHQALSHLNSLRKRDLHAERGHNSAGAWAALVMLLLVFIQASTGLFIADEDEFLEGALYGSVDSTVSDMLYNIHQNAAQLLLAIVALHIAMIFLYWFWGRQNLIVPMITGKMVDGKTTDCKTQVSHTDANSQPPFYHQKNRVGALLAIVAGVCTAWLCGWFPQ